MKDNISKYNVVITFKLKIEGALRECSKNMSILPVGDEYKLVGEDKDLE